MQTVQVGDQVTVMKHVYTDTFFTIGERYEVKEVHPDGLGYGLRSKQGVVLFVAAANCKTDPRLTSDEYIAKIGSDDLEETMKTEGVKKDQGKAPISLIDPKFIEGVAQVLAFGAKKYDAHNWRKGMKTTRLLDSSLRHIFSYLDGESLDPESQQLHLYHAACGLMFAASMHNTRPDLDDRYKKDTDDTE